MSRPNHEDHAHRARRTHRWKVCKNCKKDPILLAALRATRKQSVHYPQTTSILKQIAYSTPENTDNPKDWRETVSRFYTLYPEISNFPRVTMTLDARDSAKVGLGVWMLLSLESI